MSIYCYLRLVDHDGRQLYQQYVYLESDHQKAANSAVQAVHGYARVEAILTFDSEPRRWSLGALELAGASVSEVTDLLKKDSLWF